MITPSNELKQTPEQRAWAIAATKRWCEDDKGYKEAFIHYATEVSRPGEVREEVILFALEVLPGHPDLLAALEKNSKLL